MIRPVFLRVLPFLCVVFTVWPCLAQIELPKLGDEAVPTGRFSVTPPGSFHPPGEKKPEPVKPPEVVAAPLPPSRTDAGLSKAEFFLMKEKYAEALEPIDDVLKRHPGNADAYTYRGIAFEGLGDDEAAEKNFRKALEIDPAHLGANRYLGELLVKSGAVARAVEQLAVIRMICGVADCAEETALESAINNAKNSAKAEK